MTLFRVVALAQASAMMLLLLPGLPSPGPALVRAALRPAEPDRAAVFEAEGKGIGCVTSASRYRGPGLPKDPPWPPGAEPTPSPSPSPSPEPTPDPDASPEPPPEAVAMTFVSASRTRTVQADLGADPDATLRPSPDLVTGIDVSHHNGDIDYAAVREAGHRFVFIKATQDNDFIDPMFPTNLARARAAGLSAGAYHFFDYTLDGREQADHFLDRVAAAGGLDDALPPVVDVECWAPIGASIHAVSAARLRDFVERIYERTGLLPLVYTSVHMWREVVGNAEGFEDLPLWAACWGCEAPPSIAPGWDEWTFWQEGLTGIPGVGQLDGNYYRGGRKELRALETRPFAIAGGAPASAGGLVQLDLGGRAGTHIRTSPDGEDWSEWRPLRTIPTGVIPETEGEHTIYAQLRNGPGLKSPVLSDSVFVDDTPPEVGAPAASLRPGPLDETGAIPVAVRWQARDETAGLSAGSVTVACGPGSQVHREAVGQAVPGGAALWAAETWLAAGDGCTLTAVGVDGAGNSGRQTTTGSRVTVLPVETDEGTHVRADEVGVIARRGPEGGRAAVLLDGEAIGLVDLYAPEASLDVVHTTPLPDGDHVIALEPTGSSGPAGDGRAVEALGFAALTRAGAT